ncbi:MAG: protoporphyrinogen oxidase, partial [Acidimicrobiales bacterium]
MRVGVIGGGISGLAAAWELRNEAEVTVFEPERVGGKILTSELGGHPVDEGADAFVSRDPEALRLCQELGIESEVVAPAAGGALIWSEGRLHKIPAGLVLGAPTRLAPIVRSGLIGPWGVARAALDALLPPHWVGEDLAVGELLVRRFGHDVTDRLVAPLLGTIHATPIEVLSARATAPQLLEASRHGRSMMRGLRSSGAARQGPGFLAPRGGMGR